MLKENLQTGVRDLSKISLAELIRQRKQKIDQPAQGEFNSSI